MCQLCLLRANCSSSRLSSVFIGISYEDSNQTRRCLGCSGIIISKTVKGGLVQISWRESKGPWDIVMQLIGHTLVRYLWRRNKQHRSREHRFQTEVAFTIVYAFFNGTCFFIFLRQCQLVEIWKQIYCYCSF
jgi:hypothetical protein